MYYIFYKFSKKNILFTMIKKIIHLADIHIPNDLKERPYADMLKLCLAEILNEVKAFEKDEIRIVLAGDIFHNKIKTTNEAKSLFHEMLNYLNAIGKTIIIAGNHDMLENNQDKLDSISPTFDIKGVYPNIIYVDKKLNYKSGFIVDDNVIWVLYSMFDKYNSPEIGNLRKEYPKHKIIGLFHGEVTGAKTDTGRIFENGIDTKIFENCDYVMAGHIHKYQTIKKNGVPIVYAGSLFQQDSGENTTGHGFVVWDILNDKYSLHEVRNNHRFYKFKITSYEDVKNDVEKLINL